MRFLRLELRAFGPFTGAALDFGSREQGLHIVYGSNEAGKTSALRAVRQALFGIDQQTGDSFRHDYPDLRIGVKLQCEDGRIIEFVRRKGLKNVLRGPDDESPFDAGELAACLAGIDEPTFCSQFALDHQELRAGGDLVERAGGSMGELLFAAGGGIRELRRVEEALRDEAARLFIKGGKNPSINKHCKDYDEALKRAKAARLPTDEWIQLEDELRLARQRSDQLGEQLRDLRTRRDRLSRYAQAMRLIARRAEWRAALAGVKDAALLPDGFGTQYLEAITALNKALSNQQAAEEEIAALDAELALLDVPAALTEQGEAIDELVKQFHAADKARRDRPGLVSRRESRMADALRLLRGVLRRDAELGDADALRLTPDQKVRLQELGQQSAGLQARLAAATEQVAGLRLQRAAHDKQLAALPEPPDFGELERAVRRAQQQGDLPDRLREERRQLEAARSAAELELRRLPLWSGDLDALVQLCVPDGTSLDRCEQEFALADEELRRLAGRREDLEAEAAECERQLAELAAHQDVPSEGDLAAARQRRDALWRLVRQALHSGQPDPVLLDELLPAGESELPAAYEQSIARADRLADRLRLEAERVARKASLVAAQVKARQRLSDVCDKLNLTEGRRHKADAEWLSLWQPLGIQPLSPREMRGWLGRQARLCAAAAQIRTLDAQEREHAAAVARHEQDLREQLAGFDRAAAAAEPLAALLDRANCVASELQRQRTERQDVQRELARVDGELPKAEHVLSAVQNELAAWQSQWADEMQRLGLDPTASPAQAAAVVATFDELQQHLQEAEALRIRIEGIDREVEQLAAEAQALAARAAGDLRGAEVERIVGELRSRLQEARDKEARRADRLSKREREERRRQEACDAARQATATVQTLCKLARCSHHADLPAADQRSTHRRECEGHLRSINEELLLLTAGTPLDEFITQAAQVDPAQLTAERDALDEQISSVEQQQLAARDEIGRLEERQTGLRAGSSADLAAAATDTAIELLARIQHDAEHYARLRLAAVILRKSIERYRDKNQGPVLHSASRLFEELTLGSFQGLRPDFDDEGRTVVRGQRDGGTLGAEALSDGTRDQLYLALRLASLQHYLDQHRPCPLLVDDILVHFDDQRAAAALTALADLAQRTQVIFFTHHEHLVRLAEAHLGPSRVHVQQLDCREANSTENTLAVASA